MPSSHFTEHAKMLKNPRQPIKELIAGRLATSSVTTEELAEAIGVSDQTIRNRMKQPIEQWPYGQIIKACRYLGISTEELREKVRV